jgi:hypothetical protein
MISRRKIRLLGALARGGCGELSRGGRAMPIVVRPRREDTRFGEVCSLPRR